MKKRNSLKTILILILVLFVLNTKVIHACSDIPAPPLPRELVVNSSNKSFLMSKYSVQLVKVKGNECLIWDNSSFENSLVYKVLSTDEETQEMSLVLVGLFYSEHTPEICGMPEANYLVFGY